MPVLLIQLDFHCFVPPFNVDTDYFRDCHLLKLPFKKTLFKYQFRVLFGLDTSANMFYAAERKRNLIGVPFGILARQSSAI